MLKNSGRKNNTRDQEFQQICCHENYYFRSTTNPEHTTTIIARISIVDLGVGVALGQGVGTFTVLFLVIVLVTVVVRTVVAVAESDSATLSREYTGVRFPAVTVIRSDQSW